MTKQNKQTEKKISMVSQIDSGLYDDLERFSNAVGSPRSFVINLAINEFFSKDLKVKA